MALSALNTKIGFTFTEIVIVKRYPIIHYCCLIKLLLILFNATLRDTNDRCNTKNWYEQLSATYIILGHD